MKHGYVRLSKLGAKDADQRAVLAAAGVESDRVHTDDQIGKPPNGGPAALHARAEAIHCVRPGDVLLVATPGRLGLSREDIRATIGQIAERGGMVQVAGGKPFGGPEVAALVAFESAGHMEVERERLVPAHRARGVTAARRLTDKQKATLLPMWRDPNTHTGAEELGVKMSRRTAYKLLGLRVQGER